MSGEGSVGEAIRPVYLGNQGVGATINPVYLGAPVQHVAPGTDQTHIQVAPTKYAAGDVTYLPLGSVQVAAGAVNVQVGPLRPDRPFKPQKLFCPSTQFGLLINAITIEGTNLLASSLGMAIEAFAEDSQLPQILYPDILPATGVTFFVTNLATQALLFQPAFYGVDVRR